MESKIDRVMCATCVYWSGYRERLEDKPKVAVFDDTGICQCPISSKSGEVRKKDAKCKEYLNFTKV